MRVAFAVGLALHAAIHLLGVAKGFGLAPVSQLAIPISRTMGGVWLGAAVLLIAATVTLFVAPRWFWAVGAAALVLSQAAIVTSWADARFGTLPNLLLLLVAVYGAFAWGPFGLRAEYERRVREGLARLGTAPAPAVVTEADLAALPGPVQRYLRFAGVVGAPRPQGFRARMTGRIRGSATAPWMPFTAEQHNVYDPPLRAYGPFGPYRLATRGEGRYAPASGDYAYLEIEIQEITTDVAPGVGGGG